MNPKGIEITWDNSRDRIDRKLGSRTSTLFFNLWIIVPEKFTNALNSA